jgi:Flp pilus assembly protein TadB
MLELIKLITDLFVLRDLKQQQEYSGNSMLLGFGFVIFLFATVFPAGLLAINHPRYTWVFFTAVVLNLALLVYVLILGTRWQRQARNRYYTEASNKLAAKE